MAVNNISIDQIRTEDNFNLVSLYGDNDDDNEINDSPFQNNQTICDYYEPSQFQNCTANLCDAINYFHINCRGLSSNWEIFCDLLCDLNNAKFAFDLIGLSEVYRCENDARLCLPGYHPLLTRCRDSGIMGGVGLFVKDNINYKIRDEHFHATCI